MNYDFIVSGNDVGWHFLGELFLCKDSLIAIVPDITDGMWIRFVLYGLGGWCGEVLFTAVTESIPRKDWRLTGTTYLWMFPIYGLLAIFYEPMHDLIRDLPWWGRAVIWSLGFTLIELTTGWLIAKVSGRCPWDYVAAGQRFAINPYIRWDFFFVWAVIGLALDQSTIS